MDYEPDSYGIDVRIYPIWILPSHPIAPKAQLGGGEGMMWAAWGKDGLRTLVPMEPTFESILSE